VSEQAESRLLRAIDTYCDTTDGTPVRSHPHHVRMEAEQVSNYKHIRELWRALANGTALSWTRDDIQQPKLQSAGPAAPPPPAPASPSRVDRQPRPRVRNTAEAQCRHATTAKDGHTATA